MTKCFVIAVVLTGSLCGCGSSYSRMKSEDQIAPFGELARAYSAMPTQIVRVQTVRADEPPIRVAIHKSGNRSATGPILVFIHGLFSESSAWRYMAGALGTDHMVWLIDLPGCGASEKPHPSRLTRDGYGPTGLADRIYQALAAELAAEPLERRVVLVGHSLGSAIAMRMMADPVLREAYGPTRLRVSGLVLLTPLDVAIEKPIPVLEYVAHVHDLEIVGAQVSGVLRERLAAGVMQSYGDPDRAPREEVDRSVRMLTASSSRRALQAMIVQATPRRPKPVRPARPDWPRIDRLVMQYSNIDVPVRIACGAHDETFPASMSYKLAAQVPCAGLVVIRDCMHSPHLERPREAAAIIEDFIGAADASKSPRLALESRRKCCDVGELCGHLKPWSCYEQEDLDRRRGR